MEVTHGDGTAAEKAAPTSATLASNTTWAGLAFYFLGSILFIAGALGFLLSTTAYVQSWLWPFQLGAFAWILGSLAYLVPLLTAAAKACLCGTPTDKASGSDDTQLRHRDRRCPWGVGEAGSALCLLAFFVGCSLVFFGPAGVADEVQVTNNLPAMNVAASFTYAGAAGGYGADHDTITSGMVMWVVGSVVLFAQALYVLAVKRGVVVEWSDDQGCEASQ